MKITKDAHKGKKKTPPRAPTPVVVDNTNTEVAKSIASLAKVIEGKELSLGDDLVAGLEKMGEKERVQYEKLITHLSSKMDSVIDTLKKKPTSFEFDVRRNQYGLIDTVLVKPAE